MYGSRRRRYSRRRSYGNAARAALKGRLTLAPRHQYLKLKRIYHFRDATVGIGAPALATTAGFISIPLQLPGYLVSTTSQYASIATIAEANGWSAYSNLFQRYCVAGVKVKITFTSHPYLYSRPAANQPDFLCAVTRSAFPYDSGDLPTDWEDNAVSPYGVTGICTREKPLTIKQYINMNSLFGEIVKKHDKYVHDWDASPAGDPTSKIGALVVSTSTPSASSGQNRDYLPCVTISAVFYIHALQVSPLGVPPVALAQMQAISKPGGWLGEEGNDASYIQRAQEGQLPANNKMIAKANKSVVC